jgi:hypothetical protein
MIRWTQKIAEALRRRHALFLCSEPRRASQVLTMSVQMINIASKAFAKKCGLDWELATHQPGSVSNASFRIGT